MWLKQLTRLKSLALSRNELTGCLPAERDNYSISDLHLMGLEPYQP